MIILGGGAKNRGRSMITNHDRKTAEELKNRLLAHNGARVRRVILYGSRALGTATPESDFDLLVVEADPVTKREEMQRLANAVTGAGVSVHVWVMGELEFEKTK